MRKIVRATVSLGVISIVTHRIKRYQKEKYRDKHIPAPPLLKGEPMLDLFLWVIIGLSYLFAAISSFIIFFPAKPDSVPPASEFYWMLWLGWIFGTICLMLQAKRDLYTVCLFTSVTGFLIAFICGAVVLYGTEPHPITVGIAGIGAILMIASIVYIGWSEYGTDKMPNILRQHFRRSSIVEADGVQFVSFHTGQHVSPGESFKIVLFLQNCWNAERTVRFSLESESNKSLIYPQETEFFLPPGAVMKVSIPVQAMQNIIGQFSLLGGVRVNRGEGSRIRRWHAQGHTPPISTTMRVLALVLTKHFFGRGGLKFEGQIMPSRMLNHTSDPEQTSSIQTEFIWTMQEPFDKLSIQMS